MASFYEQFFFTAAYFLSQALKLAVYRCAFSYNKRTIQDINSRFSGFAIYMLLLNLHTLSCVLGRFKGVQTGFVSNMTKI